MSFLLFASAYSSTPRPPSLSHIHPTFQPVHIAWACESGWYFVRPVCLANAPTLYRSGWYVHRVHLHLVFLPKEVSHA